MSRYNTKGIEDKKKLLREGSHLTRPPRLESMVKENMMQPVKKGKKLIRKTFLKM